MSIDVGPSIAAQIGGIEARISSSSAGAVLLAPAVDVVPFDPVALDGDDVADILPILRAMNEE